jgi:cation transport regulator
MPYRYVSGIAEAQTDQHDKHQREAFLKAFDNVFERYGHGESCSLTVARPCGEQGGNMKASPDGSVSRIPPVASASGRT